MLRVAQHDILREIATSLSALAMTAHSVILNEVKNLLEAGSGNTRFFLVERFDISLFLLIFARIYRVRALYVCPHACAINIKIEV